VTAVTDIDRTGETRAQVRVLRLLSALSGAGVEEVGVQDFHAFAFFTDVLAPVWGLESPTGDILKEEGGPHYPMLQMALDRLVGLGLVRVARLTGDDRGGRWRLDVTFSIRIQVAAPVIAMLDAMPDEDPAIVEFLEQLAFSFAEIPAERRDDAALVDALWSAAGYDDNRLIEFTTDRGGRVARNYSADAARRFQRFAPKSVDLSPAEQTSLYMSLMRRRASA
jgi:hypothetical protein